VHCTIFAPSNEERRKAVKQLIAELGGLFVVTTIGTLLALVALAWVVKKLGYEQYLYTRHNPWRDKSK